MKKFLASLLNEPWLVEEAWLEIMVQNFLVDDITMDQNALEVLKSERLSETRSASVRGNIAHIPIHGPIFAKPNILTEWLGIGVVLSDIVGDLQTVLDNPDIESIVLDVDSPGGTVTGINEATNFIKEASKEKPITAYVGGVGASAAYWLASGANEIVLDATARVGSIGVVVAYPNPQGEDSDYIEIVNTASPKKRPDVGTEEGKKVITAELDDLADIFIKTIAENRGVSSSEVKSDFGQGGVLVGQKAVNVGMADRLGSFEGLMAENNNYEGDISMKLTIDKLKADHRDIYDQVVASVVPDTSAIETSHAEEITAKDEEIAGLKEKLTASKTTEEGLTDRVKALEKRDTLRDEESLKAKAEGIMAATLGASTLPERLHSKVGQIDYNAYVSDGKFDEAKYTDAVKAEVKDWEDTIGEATPAVQGIGSTQRSSVPSEDDDADSDAVKRMLGHVQTKKEA